MQSVVAASQPVSQVVSSSSATISSSKPKVENPGGAVYTAHNREYKQIQSDLIKVVIVNGALFALIFGLYFVNRSNHFLDNLYNRFF